MKKKSSLVAVIPDPQARAAASKGKAQRAHSAPAEGSWRACVGAKTSAQRHCRPRRPNRGGPPAPPDLSEAGRPFQGEGVPFREVHPQAKLAQLRLAN